MTSDKNFSKKQLYIAAIAAVFLIAVFVRVFRFGTVPGGMNQDGAMAAVAACRYLE